MSSPAELPATNPTESALAAAIADAAEIPAFLATLAEGLVYVPVVQASDEAGQVAFPTVRSEGEAFIAVYTSAEALALAGRDGEPHITLSGRALAEMWPAGTNMALNPRADSDVALPSSVVSELARGEAGR